MKTSAKHFGLVVGP